MKNTSANKATVHEYMRAFAAGERDAVLACLTDDIEWVMPGGFHHRGKAAFRAEIRNAAFRGDPEITVTRTVEEDGVVVSEGRVRTETNDGKVIHVVFCDVFEMQNTKVRRLTSYVMMLPNGPAA